MVTGPVPSRCCSHAVGFPDRADRCAIDVIIRQSRDLRRQHRKSVARSRARKIHEPGLVDPQMMNPVNENHARRMGNPARHVEPRSHRALRRGKRDLLRIQAMPFQPHEKTGSVGIEKLNQKNIAAQLIAKSSRFPRPAEESTAARSREI